jgi:hypothetical protein
LQALNLFNAHIKGTSVPCFGTTVPSSGRTNYQFLNSIATGRLLPVAIQFQYWKFILPEEGTVVPKHGGEAPLICVLIKTVSLFCVIKSAPP